MLFVPCWQTEDKVDELTEELLQTRHRLQATEEEKRGKEEEAVMARTSISIYKVMLCSHKQAGVKDFFSCS